MNKYKNLTLNLTNKTIKKRFRSLGCDYEIMLFSDNSYAIFAGAGTLGEEELTEDIKKDIEEIKRLKFINEL